MKHAGSTDRHTRAARPLVVLALLVALAACSGPGFRGPARHVIFISMDTARADHFGFMGLGDTETPNLDALARESTVFTDYMTVVPTTLASHVTLLTGTYPHTHGVARNGFTVHPANAMLPEILGERGFRTAGFAGSFALDSRFGFAQGLEHYDESFDVLVSPKGADQNQRTAGDVTDAVIRFLDGRSVPRNLFLFVHYFDPHYPYEAPEAFRAERGAPSDSIPFSAHSLRADPNVSLAAKGRWAERYEREYALEIAYMDREIGRLVDDLRRRGILDEAILVVTSDHGESLWEHGEQFDHGYGVYQSTMHAVCMIRLPGGEHRGARRSGVVASIDVLPTVLGFLGIDLPGEVDGEAIALDEEGPVAERTRFGQATKPSRGLESNPQWTNSLKARCIRRGPYKLVQTPYRKSEEFYDVASDPAETRNLISDLTPEMQTTVDQMRSDLEQWTLSADPLPSRFESSQKRETIERLRSLGYFD